MPVSGVTLPSRCDECEGQLIPRADHLCAKHQEERRKEKQRERARRYRRRKKGLPEADGLALTAEQVRALRELTATLTARENQMRAWAEAQRRASPPGTIPDAVSNYFTTGVRVRRALSGLTDLPG